MSRVVYLGNVAGLVSAATAKEKGLTPVGNSNSPFDYTVVCTCKTELGPLGRFRANEDGFRSVYCPTCKHVTIIDRDAQIRGYAPFKDSQFKEGA